MIKTLYGSDELVANPTNFTFVAALLIGAAFGFALERAGFGSSRKLAGIFYFRDMTVLKVMFTALITAMLGLSYLLAVGWIELDQLHLLDTIYGAQAVGGLIFGLGFVIGGWCPGTAPGGDALTFLGGAVLGSIAFSESTSFAFVQDLRTWGAHEEPLFAFGLDKTMFGLGFTLVAVGAFFFAEWAERRTVGGGKYLGSGFLNVFSVVLVALAVVPFFLPRMDPPVALASLFGGSPAATAKPDAELLAAIDQGADHIEPEDLADRLVGGEPDLVVVDVRTPEEHAAFHIRGSVHIPMAELPERLEPHRNLGTIVLYSNGMTHPAQARDVLARLGFQNAYLLTDGLDGFRERVLKPVSLRREPLTAEQAERVRTWRAFFLADTEAPAAAAPEVAAAAPAPLVEAPGPLPGLVDTDWLAGKLGQPGLRIIDSRLQPAFNTSHIPGSVRLDVENLRGSVGGVSSVLLPADMLSRHFSLIGLEPSDLVVIVPTEVRDGTLVGMALSRVGHTRWAVLNGGFDKWVAEGRPVTGDLPKIAAGNYPVPVEPDRFTVDADAVLAATKDGKTRVLDVRPGENFRGEKSDEPRAGHIPGSVNRSYKDDLTEAGQLKPAAELAAAYEKLLGPKDTPVIVHCRTGHQASQSYFVLKHLLGYENVRWYDGSWTEWSARPELPVEK